MDRIYVGGLQQLSGLGENAFCKVHAWCKGLELEANTLRFVCEKAPEVPVPEVIHSWIDRELNRAFLITKRVRGQTLERAWLQLTSSQRTRIAHHVAQSCDILATHTSSRFETVSGCGVYEPRLMEDAPLSHPSWLPRILGPFSQEALRDYMANISTEPPQDINLPFHFYHADLGPTNIMISEDGSHVTGIIDWESAAYYPQFWIATKPVYAGSFWLECETDEPKLWGQLLGQALDAYNYRQVDATFRRWSKSVNQGTLDALHNLFATFPGLRALYRELIASTKNFRHIEGGEAAYNAYISSRKTKGARKPTFTDQFIDLKHQFNTAKGTNQNYQTPGKAAYTPTHPALGSRSGSGPDSPRSESRALARSAYYDDPIPLDLGRAARSPAGANQSNTQLTSAVQEFQTTMAGIPRVLGWWTEPYWMFSL
ncbi:hypothetical protein IL306_014377 [Fusarium sp. DS 682]|nr:hypothetical protein IL306_014377 [Fusarium sp. DS 682]